MPRRIVAGVWFIAGLACRTVAPVVPQPVSPARTTTANVRPASPRTLVAPSIEGTLPTRYDGWWALYDGLNGGSASLADGDTDPNARLELCANRCEGQPPWLIVESSGVEPAYRLVAPTSSGGLWVSPPLASTSDVLCEGDIRFDLETEGRVRNLTFEIQDAVSTLDPSCASDDSCEEICRTWRRTCRVRFVAQTLEVKIEDCPTDPPDWGTP